MATRRRLGRGFDALAERRSAKIQMFDSTVVRVHRPAEEDLRAHPSAGA
jgi:hypothetical protein